MRSLSSMKDLIFLVSEEYRLTIEAYTKLDAAHNELLRVVFKMRKAAIAAGNWHTFLPSEYTQDIDKALNS